MNFAVATTDAVAVKVMSTSLSTMNSLSDGRGKAASSPPRSTWRTRTWASTLLSTWVFRLNYLDVSNVHITALGVVFVAVDPAY